MRRAVVWSSGDRGAAVTDAYVIRQADALAGGSTEIQRNIISERVLGLPREAAADRGVPVTARYDVVARPVETVAGRRGSRSSRRSLDVVAEILRSVRARAAPLPTSDSLWVQGLDAARPEDSFEGYDPQLRDDVSTILAYMTHGLLSALASGRVDASDMLDVYERTVMRLTAYAEPLIDQPVRAMTSSPKRSSSSRSLPGSTERALTSSRWTPRSAYHLLASAVRAPPEVTSTAIGSRPASCAATRISSIS